MLTHEFSSILSLDYKLALPKYPISFTRFVGLEVSIIGKLILWVPAALFNGSIEVRRFERRPTTGIVIRVADATVSCYRSVAMSHN